MRMLVKATDKTEVITDYPIVKVTVGNKIHEFGADHKLVRFLKRFKSVTVSDNPFPHAKASSITSESANRNYVWYGDEALYVCSEALKKLNFTFDKFVYVKVNKKGKKNAR